MVVYPMIRLDGRVDARDQQSFVWHLPWLEREPTEDFDNVTYPAKSAPYAQGMSFRNQFSETLTAQMIQIARIVDFMVGGV